MSTADEPLQPASLRDLAVFFLRLGVTAFGGPAAHIAMMEEEVVRRRRWLSPDKFLDLLAAANMLPGPTSTELAIYIGYVQRGWVGLLLGGCCFILPAAGITLVIAWAYVRFGKLPEVGWVLYGVKPVVIAVILQALWRLGRSALKSPFLVGLGVVGVALNLLGVNQLALLFGSGAVAGAAQWLAGRRRSGPASPSPLPAGVPAVPLGSAGKAATVAAAAAAPAAAIGLWPLALAFLKVGALLFGSGYVLLAFLRADLVQHHHWLTEAQLIDAVAIGQVTPGPVFSTATFIGYVLAGGRGAGVATVAIFLPSFLLVALSGPVVSRVRRSPTGGAFLDGVTVAALTLMAVVTWQLGWVALVDLATVAIAIAAALLLLRFRVNSAWLVLGGASIGVLVHVLGLR